MSDPLTDRLRALCLALPEATEKEAWGDATFRVRDKIFAMAKHGGGRRSVWCKAAEGLQGVMIEADPALYFVPPYVGAKGWVGLVLAEPIDWGGVESLVAGSYRLVAPKRLARQVCL